MNTQTQKEILDSISKSGSTELNDIINGNIDHVVSRSSGSPRIQPNAVKKFKLILSQPKEIGYISALAIRCVLCKKVTSYPCWYFNIKYSVNHFHYFLCFDSNSPAKPSTRCYRREK